jgi:hypothetical protein
VERMHNKRRKKAGSKIKMDKAKKNTDTWQYYGHAALLCYSYLGNKQRGYGEFNILVVVEYIHVKGNICETETK